MNDEATQLTPRMITDEMVRRFKESTEWFQALHDALSAATTEEQKRAVRKQFKADADARIAAARSLNL